MFIDRPTRNAAGSQCFQWTLPSPEGVQFVGLKPVFQTLLRKVKEGRGSPLCAVRVIDQGSFIESALGNRRLGQSPLFQSLRWLHLVTIRVPRLRLSSFIPGNP